MFLGHKVVLNEETAPRHLKEATGGAKGEIIDMLGADIRQKHHDLQVKFENGEIRNVPISYLSPAYVEDANKEHAYKHERPLLPGNKVTFNFNITSADKLKRQFGNDTGYIIHNLSAKNWNRMSEIERQSSIVKIKLTNGKTVNCKHFELIPIETKSEEVTIYHTIAGKTFLVGDETSEELDKEIIVKRMPIQKVEVWDDEKRQIMLADLEIEEKIYDDFPI